MVSTPVKKEGLKLDAGLWRRAQVAPRLWFTTIQTGVQGKMKPRTGLLGRIFLSP
jgi:hypothetical protein